MKSRAPIFIGGMMKSGTSLLRKLVARHSQVFGGLETHWFSEHLQRDWRDPYTRRAEWLRGFFDVTLTDYVSLIDRSASGADLFDQFMTVCAQRANKERWVEKTPDNVLHFDLARAVWPDARALHVVRDHRDIYASWKRNDKLSLEAFLTQAHQIREKLGVLYGAPHGWYAEVRYEDLVREVEPTMRSVIQHIEVAWEDEVATYSGDDSDHRKVLEVTGKASATTESLKRPVFDSSVGQWRALLDADEVAIIERELGDALGRWGYA